MNTHNNSTSVGARLVAFWSTHPRLILGPPARASEIRLFEQENRTTLPGDLIEYLYLVNGFDQQLGHHEGSGFNFWPLENFRRVSDYEGGAFAFPKASSYFIFADYLDFSWAYAIDLLPNSSTNEIVIIGMASGKTQTVADTFARFVDLYISGDERLYPE